MNIVVSLIIFFSAVIIHEYCHGWVAYKLGDPTAKYAGRLTLNPLEHIDPVGTVLLPLMLVMMRSSFVFGWAKPVPVNFWNLRNPRRDMMWVGLAGPMANFMLAIALSQLLKITPEGIYSAFLIQAIMINLIFAVFNLMPIPPLDGSRIVSGLLSDKYAMVYNQWERYGVIIVFLFLFLGMFNLIVLPLAISLGRWLGAI